MESVKKSIWKKNFVLLLICDSCVYVCLNASVYTKTIKFQHNRFGCIVDEITEKLRNIEYLNFFINFSWIPEIFWVKTSKEVFSNHEKASMEICRCESHGPGSFAPGRKDPGLVMKLSITSLYIISDAPSYDIIWIENSDAIDSFISEILKYESSMIHVLDWKPLGHTIHTVYTGAAI